MFGISEFFKRVQNSFTKEVLSRTAIKEAIKKVTGIDIAIEDINQKDGIVMLKKLDSAARSVIFIKKNRILEEIRIGQAILDIR